MTHRTKTLRFAEMTLWVVGLVLLGVASASTFSRWHYQKQQERALFQGGPAVAAVSVPELQRPAESTDTPANTVASPAPAQPVTATPPPAKEKARARAALVPDPAAFGRIEIPRLGVEAIVKHGSDEKTLSLAVGRVPGSARPGQPGNMVLAGHRDTFFRPLRNIRVNDRIRLVTPAETYEYEVQWVSVVAPHDTRVLDANGGEELTLVTCYPFSMVGPAPDRFIVNALRVN